MHIRNKELNCGPWSLFWYNPRSHSFLRQLRTETQISNLSFGRRATTNLQEGLISVQRTDYRLWTCVCSRSILWRWNFCDSSGRRRSRKLWVSFFFENWWEASLCIYELQKRDGNSIQAKRLGWFRSDSSRNGENRVLCHTAWWWVQHENNPVYSNANLVHSEWQSQLE